jgi:Holliday junction resolvasome RuvABC endonuclease subunit
MIIISYDLGTTAKCPTVRCIHNTLFTGMLSVEFATYAPPKKTINPQSAAHIGYTLYQDLPTFVRHIDCIAYEAPIMGHSARGSLDTALVAGAICLLWHRISFMQDEPPLLLPVLPSEAKLALAGKGNAEKEEMIAAAQLLLGRTDMTSHEADAYAVGLVAINTLEQPHDRAKKQRRAPKARRAA